MYFIACKMYLNKVDFKKYQVLRIELSNISKYIQREEQQKGCKETLTNRPRKA